MTGMGPPVAERARTVLSRATSADVGWLGRDAGPSIETVVATRVQILDGRRNRGGQPVTVEIAEAAPLAVRERILARLRVSGQAFTDPEYATVLGIVPGAVSLEEAGVVVPVNVSEFLSAGIRPVGMLRGGPAEPSRRSTLRFRRHIDVPGGGPTSVWRCAHMAPAARSARDRRSCGVRPAPPRCAPVLSCCGSNAGRGQVATSRAGLGGHAPTSSMPDPWSHVGLTTRPRRSRRVGSGDVVADLIRVAPAVDVICSAVADEQGAKGDFFESGIVGWIRLTASGAASDGPVSAGMDAEQVPADDSACRDQSEQ
jgi:hypothetical protein